MRRTLFLLFISIVLCAVAYTQEAGNRHHLTLLVLGNTGETGSMLRGTASFATDMYTGVHDAGKYDAMVFLGSNFFETGLNIPQDEVESKVKSLLGPFSGPLNGLGRDHVHALPGSHDYYARPAVERSVFFGLFTMNEGAEGISDRGNQRAATLDQWTYHYGMPTEVVYPVRSDSSSLRDSVQLIFFDSALLLRTEQGAWGPMLDSLRQLLHQSGLRPGIGWRLFCTHHPFTTVGEHGGYTLWDDEKVRVEYLSPCNRDSNASGWLKNWIEPQDLCAERYQAYIDSLRQVFVESGVPVQAVLASYDYSLQLLYAHAPKGLPPVEIISGAGARVARVKRADPARGEYTAFSPDPLNKGTSLFGFAQVRFDNECMRVVFFNGKNGNPIDMGGGAEQFCVRKDGSMTHGEYVQRGE